MKGEPNSGGRTTLVRAGTILTMTGPPIMDGAVLIRDGRIEDIGTHDRVRAGLDPEFAVNEIGSPSHIAMPGMVDAHQHGRGVSLTQAGVRDAPLEPLQFGRLASRVPDIDPYSDTLYACLSLMESGVTTVVHAPIIRDPMGENMRGEIEDVFQAYVDSGLRVQYCVAIADQNSFVYSSDESFMDYLPDPASNLGYPLTERRRGVGLPKYFELIEALDGRAKDLSQGRVVVAIGPMGPQWCSDDLLRTLREHATDTGHLIHAHCLETVFQREDGSRVYGEGVIEHLAKIGFLGPDVTLAHCVWISEREVEILAETNTHVAHNPSSNLRLRSGIAPVLRLMRSGVTVGLGSDSHSWNDDHDFFQELRVASRLHRLPGLADEELSTSEVVRMATVSGAEIAGWGSEIGQLSIGARADIVLVDDQDLDVLLLDDRLSPADYLVNRARASDVDTVLIDGEVVVEGGRHPGLNRNYVAEELERTRDGRAERDRTSFIEQAAPFVRNFYEGWQGSADTPFYVFNGKSR